MFSEVYTSVFNFITAIAQKFMCSICPHDRLVLQVGFFSKNFGSTEKIIYILMQMKMHSTQQLAYNNSYVVIEALCIC